ncbi:pimeloyl-ACP methyl ester carboxylesterase [Crossiella equi]|uniref:Pimeloyl-ACP methyl ester carboxylesterase n=2 Tax=Crossiella equi TaxID=130796 RepID=A0ABS5AC57_9PSEU|nr:alpha/beta hydrolase [Crossiella equi]MBP2473867.1 pimeloyl-ACP methyl ester carboxylesterase [Crossiella equi]
MKRSAAIAITMLLLTTACTSPVPGGGPEPVQVEQRGPKGPVPPGLDAFYGQPLGWGRCEGYVRSEEQAIAFGRRDVQCARLTVPLDYASPGGRTISLGLLRRPATDPANRVGAVVLNPGGPGGSGMSAAASLGSGNAGGARRLELARRFDLVGFDPRGIGASEPQVRCRTDAERDAERLDLDLDTSPQGVEQTEREERELAQKCSERAGNDLLATVGTRDVARDMDVLRSALGEPKLTYLGYSYGTRIGTAYAEAFPANVRAMVLDGALDPDADPVTELVAQGKGFQQAFDTFAADCARQRGCPLGTSPDRATQAFRDLLKPLVTTPAEAKGGRELSYSDATTAVIQALYSQDLWQLLRTGLAELREGKGDSLLLLADNYYGRGSDGKYSNLNDVFTAIRCVDDPRVTDPEQRRELDRRYREAAPFLDDGNQPSAVRDACAFWPVPVTSEPHQPKVDGLPPVLVVSTTGDPATPYQAGVELAAALGGRLLSFEGTQHTVFAQGNQCVDTAGTAYLTDLRLPPEGMRCR